MSEVVISRRGGKKSKGYLMTEYIESNMNWKVPNGVVNNEFNVRIIGGGAIGGSYYNYWGGGWMNNDIVRLTPGEYVQITIGNPGINGKVGYSGDPTSFGQYLVANGASESSSGSGGFGRRHGRDYERIGIIQFGGGGLGQDGGVWGGGGGSSWWWYNGAVPCEPGRGGYYGGGGGAGFPWVLGNWATASSISNGGNGGYYGGGGGGAGKLAVAPPVLNSTYQPSFVAARFSKGGTGGWYNNNGTWKQSGLAGNGGYVNINNLVFYSIRTNGEYCNDWYWRDDYSNVRKYNIHNCIIRAENGTNTIGWTNLTKDSVYNIFMNGNGFRGNSNIGNNLFLGEGGGGFGGNGGKVYAPHFNYSNIMYDYERMDYDYDEVAYFSGGGGGGYGSNGGDGILYTGANGGNSPSGDGLNAKDIIALTGGGGGGYGGDGEKSGYVTDGYCGAGGGYGKVSVGKKGGGGGYYCPGSLHIDGAGGGIGIWDGTTLVRSYGCGGQKGGCIIQYYLKVD